MRSESSCPRIPPEAAWHGLQVLSLPDSVLLEPATSLLPTHPRPKGGVSLLLVVGPSLPLRPVPPTAPLLACPP